MSSARAASVTLAIRNTLQLWRVILLAVTIAHERIHPALTLFVLVPLNHILFYLINSLQPAATAPPPFSRTWSARLALVTAFCLVASFALVMWYGSFGHMAQDLRLFLRTPVSWLIMVGLLVLTLFFYGPIWGAFRRFRQKTGLDDPGPWKALAVGMIAWFWIDALFAALIQQVSVIWGPASFTQDVSSFLNAFYFSTTTLATVGYGDIAPVSPLARGLVVVEVGVGIGLLGFILGRAVAYSQVKHGQQP